MIEYTGASQAEFMGRGTLVNGQTSRQIDVYSDGRRYWTVSGLASTGPAIRWITPISAENGMKYRLCREQGRTI